MTHRLRSEIRQAKKITFSIENVMAAGRSTRKLFFMFSTLA